MQGQTDDSRCNAGSRRQMELRCDGIAVATLRALDLPRAPLLSAVRKLTRFNERLSPAVGAEFYPSLEDRAAFIRALDQHVDTVVSTRGQRPH